MPIVERRLETNEHGYLEVALDYRIARAAMLDASRVSERTGRIGCPMLDASRTEAAYGRMALPGTEAKDLKVWADALGTSSLGIKIVAYLTGPIRSIPGAFLFGRFDDKKVNTGFLRSLKRGINTGVLTRGTFDQGALNAFVRAVRPDLEGTPMTPDWIYSEASAGEYIQNSKPMLESIRAHNKTNATPGSSLQWLGLKLSDFEMRSLLLGTLAQEVALDPRKPAERTFAILLRDVHDLFKYGLIPAAAEQRLNAAGLLDFPQVTSEG